MVALSAFGGTACRATEAGPVVLVADHWCPHTCDPKSGRDGYMVDLARAAFAREGLVVDFRARSWAEAMADVRAGRADGAVGTLADEAPDLSTNSQSLGWQTNAVVVRTGDSLRFAGLDTLQGRRIAVVKDYSYSPVINAWLTEHVYQVVAQTGDHAAQANLRRLLNFQVDAVIDDEIVLQNAIAQSGLTSQLRVAGRLPGGTLHVSFRADERGHALAEMLDIGLEALRRDGTLAELLAAYGLSAPPP